MRRSKFRPLTFETFESRRMLTGELDLHFGDGGIVETAIQAFGEFQRNLRRHNT